VGASALLIECADAGEVEAWRAEAWRRREAGDLRVDEIVPGERTVLLDGVDPSLDVITWTPAPIGRISEDSSQVRIPMTFDGDDLPDIARRWGLSESSAVERLAGSELTVAFCGFAPGFAYMRGLDPEWAVPRLETPRARVPAGAVGLAGNYVGIYPSASPGGWRLVGRTAEVLWDVERVPPARLAPGTRVRLAVAS
jgi:KipI family sensor histidine kinase inhibitor